MNSPTPDDEGWLEQLKLHGALLDGIEVAMCAFDTGQRAVAWNRSYLRLFPEHEGHLHPGEHYSDILRRFYRHRLDAEEERKLEQYIAAGVARHRAQVQPYEFEHRGMRLRVSSLPVPGRGRIRVWRTLDPLPPAAAVGTGFASDLGSELLECVPEALVVCGRDGRIVWTNASFCALYGEERRELVPGSTLEELYERVWDRSGSADPRRGHGAAMLRENLRFPGAPFELPLPDDRSCRVVARPARDGAIFYALIDISALKQYEAALQLTLDNAGRGIIRYAADGRVLLFNRQALELLDLPERLLAGHAQIEDVVRFQHERGDIVGTVQGELEKPPELPGGGYDLYSSKRYLRRTRTGLVLEIATQSLPDGGAVRTYTDVTAYVEAQHALHEKTRALEITLDSMSQGISALDASGRLVFWNRRYQELLDLPSALLASRPTLDQLVRFQINRGDFGSDFELVDTVARRYVAVGDKVPALQGPETYLRKTLDGRTYEVLTRPLPDGGVVRTFTDLTAYVHTQQALATRQAQLMALVNNLPDRVWLKDEHGMFLLSNPAHRQFHGRAEADIVGHTSLEVFGVDKGRTHEESDRVALASPTPVAFETYDFGPDGALFFSEVVKVAMRDDAGRPMGLLGIARDITRRKQEEQALIRAKEEAQQASTAKSRFLSSMSHEIRTPMNAVLGMLTLLRGTELTTRQDDYAGKAEGAARALLSLLNDILDLSKIEAGKMRLDRRPFSLEGMLGDLSVILSSNVGERDLEVLYDLDPRVPDRLVGDDMRLRQILINLGGNAVKFTERGEVVVRTRLVGLQDGHASVEFSVQDTGIGISAEQQALLFGEFVQASDDTARQFGGSGLGLGICRRLTELMGASLQLASSPGVGSRFWFTVRLPVAAIQPQPEPPEQGPARRPRVLIADDNPLARDTLAALARAAGWHADTAQDGQQAIMRVEGAAAIGLAYDVVFLDWVMPGLDGWQTCRRVRSLPLPARTPLVIMVTAHGREMLDRRPADEQALLDGFLVKPVTAGMLRRALHQARGALQPAAPAPAAAQAAPALPQPLAGRRLLLAEDNPVNQQIATELLSCRGAQVDVADNGQVALERLASGIRYDAVLMDMQMPVLDGVAATRELRKRHPAAALPVIAMTANAMDSDREVCFAAGMNDHVAKPFVIEEVVAVLLRHFVDPDRPAPPAAAPQVFDRAGALERMGGDEALLQMVLPVFRTNLQGVQRDLAGAPGAPREQVARLMHTIKGMAGNVGALALAAVAADAEQRLRTNPELAVEPLAHQVRRAVAEVLRELDAPGRAR